MAEVDIIKDHLSVTSVPFDICPYLWEKFDAMEFPIQDKEWKEVKFLNDTGDNINTLMELLPNDKGGIYVFFAKPNIIPDIHGYIMYVGRALLTEGQDLKKRCKEYFREPQKKAARPKIKSMINGWGKYLYIKYLPLDDNAYIDRLEQELINSILPPCNSKIPDKIVAEAKKSLF